LKKNQPDGFIRGISHTAVGQRISTKDKPQPFQRFFISQKKNSHSLNKNMFLAVETDKSVSFFEVFVS